MLITLNILLLEQGQSPVPPWLILFGLPLIILGVFVYSFGGPIINGLVSNWQMAYYRFGHVFFRPFSPLPQKGLSAKQQSFLFEQMHFYKHLNSKQRKSFNHRTLLFLSKRKFEAREGVVITSDMKLLIAATAVKLTFGLRRFMMREFKTIIIYPQSYFSKLGNNYHKGEVNPKGVVVLSWEDFYEGMRIPDDNLNLGVHEFAHVLALQRLHNPIFADYYFKTSFDKLMKHVQNAQLRKLLQKRLGLRDYALVNPMEFFAVATETFFENPEAMRGANPIFYKLFASMFNLDVARIFNQPIHAPTQLP